MIRCALTVACSLMLAGGPAVPTAATPAAKAEDAREELRSLKSRIDAIRKRLAEAEGSKNEAADALQASERAISDANRAVADLAQQSRSADARLAELRGEIERTRSDVEAQRAALAKLLYQRYVAGRPETLSILLNGGDPNTTARELHYFTYIGRARAELIADLRTNLERAQRLAGEAASRADELAAITAEQIRQRRKLEQEKRARSRVLAQISRHIEQQRREIGTLRRDEARLTRLIDQLSKLIARTPRQRPAPDGRAAGEPRLRNDRIPENVPEAPFAQLRGRVSLPVRGELASRFGSPRQDGGLVWKGLFIAARAGEEVRAIAAGRVVFADWLRGFGNLLIIDHGDSYMSLYGYNETLYKQVGDAIRGGDRVASVGNTGGHPDSGLYFEMRHEGRPFDPMTWVTRK